MQHRRASTGTFLAALLLLLALAIPAGAITGGDPAPEEAPYDAVGLLLLAYNVLEGDEVVDQRHVPFCSGTYVDAGGPEGYHRAFLTAAHCTFDADTYPLALQAGLSGYLGRELAYAGMEVTFAAEPWGDDPFILDDHTATIPVEVEGGNPLVIVQTLGGFGEHPGRRDDRDIALLSLAHVPNVAAVPVDTTSLTSLSRQELRAATWVSVGYGTTYVHAPGAPMMGPGGDRLASRAPGGFLSLRPGALFLSQNQARGHGGTCFGDSGGPIFLEHDEALHLVAITSWGDARCIATNFTYRLDTPTARDVLGLD